MPTIDEILITLVKATQTKDGISYFYISGKGVNPMGLVAEKPDALIQWIPTLAYYDSETLATPTNDEIVRYLRYNADHIRHILPKERLTLYQDDNKSHVGLYDKYTVGGLNGRWAFV